MAHHTPAARRATRTAVIADHVHLDSRARSISRETKIPIEVLRTADDQFLAQGNGWRVGPYPAEQMDIAFDGIELSARTLAGIA